LIKEFAGIEGIRTSVCDTASQFAEKLALKTAGAEALRKKKGVHRSAESAAPPKIEFFSTP
jgi:hypothetical protein